MFDNYQQKLVVSEIKKTQCESAVSLFEAAHSTHHNVWIVDRFFKAPQDVLRKEKDMNDEIHIHRTIHDILVIKEKNTSKTNHL